MENKVYYGEYSLSYWIRLILNKQVELPSYQRLFVWSKNDTCNLIESFKNDLFVLPVTIGQMVTEKGLVTNYILDGQQRLTSILLNYLSLFPKNTKEDVRELKERSMDENDEINLNEDELEKIQKWTFRELTSIGNTKEDIINGINEELYDKLDSQSQKFFETHFLGFSYIVPKDKIQQQKYYSSVFRNINNRGTKLQEYESRRSLYFLSSNYEAFFETSFDSYTYEINGYPAFIDFVRYMAFLSQYHQDTNERKVARGFGTRRRTLASYYENYIYSVVNGSGDETFKKFSDIFPENKYSDKIVALKKLMKELELPSLYKSIIDIDLFFFGVIYISIFLNLSINIDKAKDLKIELNSKIDELKQNEFHRRSPAALKYLRERIKSSIEIYLKYSI